MPSVSKQQQKLFGLIRALQKGDVKPSKVSKKAKKLAKDMKKSDVKKYASTKHKGLPSKVKRETKVRSLIKKMVREIINEDSLGDKFQKTIQRYQDKVRKEKEAYRKARELQKKRKKITKEQNFEKVTMPSNVKRFMKRFIDAVQSGKLNRQRQKAILYKVIKGLGISPQELMMYVQKVKKGLKNEGRGPCWKGYTQKGMKKKGDRMVPNCVKNESKLREVSGVDVAKKVLKNKQHEKGIDMQTANLIVTIHKAYNKNKPLQKKFEKIPLNKMKELILRYMS
jgi:hypothetical protein